jgi:hypothetical protein
VEAGIYPGPTRSGVFLESAELSARSLMEDGIKI